MKPGGAFFKAAALHEAREESRARLASVCDEGNWAQVLAWADSQRSHAYAYAAMSAGVPIDSIMLGWELGLDSPTLAALCRPMKR